MVCKVESRNEEQAGASRKAAEDADENQINSALFSWKLDLFFLYNCQPDSRTPSAWPPPAPRFSAGISVAPVRLTFPGSCRALRDGSGAFGSGSACPLVWPCLGTTETPGMGTRPLSPAPGLSLTSQTRTVNCPVRPTGGL